MNIEILDEQIIYQNGSYRRIKRWIKGVHPELGIIIFGLTGLETFIEKDVIVPKYVFMVNDTHILPISCNVHSSHNL